MQVVKPAVHTQEEIRDYYKAHPFDESLPDKRDKESDIVNGEIGELSQETTDNALATLNFMRYIAGVNTVDVTDNLQRTCQAAAALDAHNTLKGVQAGHNPVNPGDVPEDLYKLGAAGAGSSNLVPGQGLGGVVIGSFVPDPGNVYTGLSHRRYCLNPSMGATGFGSAIEHLDGRSEGMRMMYATDESKGWSQIHAVAWPAPDPSAEPIPEPVIPGEQTGGQTGGSGSASSAESQMAAPESSEPEPSSAQGGEVSSGDATTGQGSSKPAASGEHKGDGGKKAGSTKEQERKRPAARTERRLSDINTSTLPTGAEFSELRVRSSKTIRRAVGLSWQRVSGASRYVVYGGKCGKGNKYRRLGAKARFETANPKVATVSRTGKVKATGKGNTSVWVYAQNGLTKRLVVSVK